MSSGISLGQESGNVLGSYDKSENNFKPGFDEKTELSVSVESSERFIFTGWWIIAGSITYISQKW